VGGHKRRLGVWGRSPPQAEAFLETTHNICVKIQQTTVAVIQVEILNDITSKICPIGIDAPDIPINRRVADLQNALFCGSCRVSIGCAVEFLVLI